MTTPNPPEFDPLVTFTHKMRDEAELLLSRYRITIVVLVAVAAFLGWQGFLWHERNMARLEAQATNERAAAANEHSLGDAWRKRAIARVDSVRVDTVRIRQLIHDTKTILVPAAPPAAVDGVTYSVPLPLEPIPMVYRSDYDSLGAACTREVHDCSSALAAKDSVLAHESLRIVALDSLNTTVAKQLRGTKRGAVVQKVVWGLVGLLVGRALR